MRHGNRVDHNILREEMDAILGPLDRMPENLERLTKESNYELIYRLNSFRRNDKKAKIYLDLMPNTIHIFFCLCNHDVVDQIKKSS